MNIRKSVLAALLCGAIFCSAGCAGDPAESQPETSAAGGEETTFQDDLGREVTVSEPQRVAALIGSFADVWCLAGGKDTLVATADDAWTQFDLDLGEDVANLGAIKSPDVEGLLAAEPDFVIGSTKTAANLELMETLEQIGIPVAYFDVSSFQDYLDVLEICTRLPGHADNYRLYGLEVQDQIEQAKARCAGEEHPTVLYIRATGASCKVKNSENTVLGEMLKDLGCENIADSATGLLESLSMETIIAEDPDYIFVILQGTDTTDAEALLEASLLSNPAWDQLTAVREGRFHILDQKLYNLKPNARWGEAYEKLADILYPQA